MVYAKNSYFIFQPPTTVHKSLSSNHFFAKSPVNSGQMTILDYVAHAFATVIISSPIQLLVYIRQMFNKI